MTICFYLGKKCRYGDDVPPEDQMDCQTCPVYIVFMERVDAYKSLMEKRIAATGLTKEQLHRGKTIIIDSINSTKE